MDYDKLTKEELVKILEEIRSPRFNHRGSDPAQLVELMEALLLERHELQTQIGRLKDSLSVAKDSLSEYVDLLETAPLGYVTLDMTGCLVKANRCACALVGKDPAIVLGVPFWSLLTDESRFLFMQHFTECRRQHSQVKNVAVQLAAKAAAVPVNMTGCCTDSYRGLLSPQS